MNKLEELKKKYTLEKCEEMLRENREGCLRLELMSREADLREYRPRKGRGARKVCNTTVRGML